jgi:hypothetical protein
MNIAGVRVDTITPYSGGFIFESPPGYRIFVGFLGLFKCCHSTFK